MSYGCGSLHQLKALDHSVFSRHREQSDGGFEYPVDQLAEVKKKTTSDSALHKFVK